MQTHCLLWVAMTVVLGDSASAQTVVAVPSGSVELTTAGPAYGTGIINGTSFSPDTIITVGDQQFIAYYEPDTATDDGYDGHVVVGRRTLGSSTWIRYETAFLSNNITDAHDIIAIAVDGDGIMHISWGMHANQGGGTNYARSTASVLPAGAPISFTANLRQAGMTGNETNVTYPEFVNLPDGDLLYFYRNGSSGNGDLRLNRYDTATDQWSVVKQPLIDGYSSGDTTSNNAYWNTIRRLDGEGNLHMSWCFRRSTSSSTNRDLYYAISEDVGATWRKSDGTAYTGTITQSTSEQVVSIPEGYSLINTSGMTFDQNNRPLIVSRWAPETGAGNTQLQQMLTWFDGTDWHVSPITQFASGNPGGRSTVLVNEDGRVLVLIRGSQLGNLIIAHSMDRVNWEFLDLGISDYGLEPTYDEERWHRDGVISMLIQPTGQDVVTMQVMEFDARSYFSLESLGITGLSPVDGAAKVPVDNDLVVTFGENIALGSGLITLKNLSDNTQSTIDVTDGSQVTISGATLTIDPTTDLLESKHYAIQIATGAVDFASGGSFGGISDDTTWNFSSADPPDLTAPIINSLLPADDASGVSTSANLMATFDEPVQAGTGNIVLKRSSDGSTVEAFDVTSDVVFNGTDVTLNPTADLDSSSFYFIQIDNGAITDASGNAFAGLVDTISWNFSTRAGYAVSTTSGTGGVSGYVQNQSSTSSFGASSFHVKNSESASTTRKGYLRFDLSGLDFTPDHASLSLTVSLIDQTIGNDDQTIHVYGVTDEALDSVALTNDLNWADAPANDSSSWYQADLTKADLLGTFSLDYNGDMAAPVGTVVEFNSAALASFLASDTDGRVTLILGRTGTGSSKNLLFAGDFNSSNYAAPTLNAYLDSIPVPSYSDWIDGFPEVGISGGLNDDPDGDRISNVIEAIFGTHPAVMSRGLGDLTTNASVTTITHPRNPNPPSDLTVSYLWSSNLTDWYECDGFDGPPSGETVSVLSDDASPTTTVTATASGSSSRLFFRMQVQQN